MTFYQWLILFVLLIKDSFGLKDVTLIIKPEVVQRNTNATLICSYDLQGANLYSVKWYRGMFEFYRYTPSEKLSTKVFPLKGIQIDLDRSNSTQVVLTDIDFQLAGKFTCEVTTAEEPVSTHTDVQSMLVVQLPQFSPTISVGREPLNSGDVLQANCTSSPARPAARLKFILNDLPVGSTPPLSKKEAQETRWSDLFLNLSLKDHHFNNGKLTLRCVAQIPDIYEQEAVLELASLRNPKPEKVSALDSSCAAIFVHPIAMFTVIILSFGA